jgi:hypothetical protein
MSRDFDLVFESHILIVIHFIPYLNKIEACHPFYSENKIEMLFIHAVISQCHQNESSFVSWSVSSWSSWRV